jgi:hypothetical protein
MKNNKTQSWFLVKDNWMTDLNDLSNEDFGLLIRSLYSQTKPSGLLGTLVSSMQDEFTRVNSNSKQAKEERSIKAAKAAQARWDNAQVMLKHTQELETTTITMLEHNEALLIDADTKTKTDTITNTKTKIEIIDTDITNNTSGLDRSIVKHKLSELSKPQLVDTSGTKVNRLEEFASVFELELTPEPKRSFSELSQSMFSDLNF